jgi:hypothetical protein
MLCAIADRVVCPPQSAPARIKREATVWMRMEPLKVDRNCLVRTKINQTNKLN